MNAVDLSFVALKLPKVVRGCIFALRVLAAVFSAPRGSLDSPEADLESFLQETPRSSPTLFRQQQSEADAGMFEVKPTLPEAPLPPTTFASNSKRTNGATANKRAAPGAAPRGATTPVKEAPLKQAPRSFPSPRATLELPPAGSQRSGSEDGDEDIDASNDPAEEKRLKRMRRNRESAAMSRNRKKAYIEELEAKVNSLTSMVTALQNENWALKEECAALRGLGQEGGSSSLDQSTFRPLFGANAAAGAMAGEQSKANGGTGAGQHASASKKFGTAGLALASTLALVTLSVNAPGSMRSPFLSGRPHSPTSRVLMSLRDEFREMQSSSALASRFREEASPLWPSLDVRQDDGAIAMNAPDEAALMPKAAAARVPSRLPTQRRLESPAPERVIHLPLNSSWADALLSEAADTMPNSGDKGDSSGDSSGDSEKLLLHRHSELSLLAQRGAWDEHGREEHALRGRVYEPQWHDEPSRHAGSGGYRLPDDAFEASSEAARRFIFCARSYAFDVVKQTGQTRGSEPHSPDARAATGRAGSRELPLPTAMPARFRHAAASVPQLTDGSNTSDAHAESTLRKPQLPVVSFLLPTAALGGVAQRVPHADHEPYDADKADSDLMQVTCQVLNASRI